MRLSNSASFVFQVKNNLKKSLSPLDKSEQEVYNIIIECFRDKKHKSIKAQKRKSAKANEKMKGQ